jgi:hypothetical protein
MHRIYAAGVPEVFYERLAVISRSGVWTKSCREVVRPDRLRLAARR